MTQVVNIADNPQATKFNVAEARFNMIEQQIRTWEVLDPVVLAVLEQVPRENFVAESHLGLAFADVELPIGEDQTMLSPKIEGRILQAVGVKKTDKVLLVGTGSGYLTALLATLADHVHAVEIFPELSNKAQYRLQAQNIRNVTLYVADAANGFAKVAPYDVIVFTGSLPLRPLAAEQMLNKGGRLFAVVGDGSIMQATLSQRINDDAFRYEVIFETLLPPLENAPRPTKFNF